MNERYCIYCGEPTLEGLVCCKKCYEFGKKYNTTP